MGKMIYPAKMTSGWSARKHGGSKSLEYAQWTLLRGEALRHGVPRHFSWNIFTTWLQEFGPAPSPLHRLRFRDKKLGFVPGNIEWRKMQIRGEATAHED